MKFVKTFRAPLSTDQYTWDIFTSADLQNLFSFHQRYPAPVNFMLKPDPKYAVSEKILQVLAMWYLQGTVFTYHKGFSDSPDLPIKNLACSKPQPRWAYTFVDEVPQHYIKANCTNAQDAYAYGQRLIAACNKANQIPFSTLEETYKALARTLLSNAPRLKVYSPNAKTILEVKAELQTAKELAELAQATADFSDEADLLVNLYNEWELNLYSRVFNIQMPEWSLKFKMLYTKHGFAKVPELHMTNTAASTANSDYDGADADFQESMNKIPYTLRRDSLPTSIHKRNLTIELAQTISWYLHTFKETKDETLLNPDWGYCENCGFYQRDEGCQCGAIPSLEEIELSIIEDTYKAIAVGSYVNRLKGGE